MLADAQGCAIQLVGGTTCLLVTSSCVLALLKTKILRIKTLRRRTSPNANRVGREISLLQTWWYIIIDVRGEWVEETENCEKEGLDCYYVSPSLDAKGGSCSKFGLDICSYEARDRSWYVDHWHSPVTPYFPRCYVVLGSKHMLVAHWLYLR